MKTEGAEPGFPCRGREKARRPLLGGKGPLTPGGRQGAPSAPRSLQAEGLQGASWNPTLRGGPEKITSAGHRELHGAATGISFHRGRCEP